MRAPFLPLLLAAALASPDAASAAGKGGEEAPWLEGSYQGKYASTPFYQDFARRLPAHRRKALAQVEKRLGALPGDPEAVRIRLRDAESLPEGELKEWARAPAAVELGGEGGGSVVTLFLEPFASGEADPVGDLAYGLAKGMLLAACGGGASGERLSAVEGLAWHAAGEEAVRCRWRRLLMRRRWLAAANWRDRAKAASGNGPLEEFVADVGCVRALAKKEGPKGISALVGSLGKGDLALPVSRAEGLDLMKKERAEVEGDEDALIDAADRIASESAKDADGFARALEVLLRRNPRAYWAAECKVLVARAYAYKNEQQMRPIQIYEEVLSAKPPLSPAIADAANHLAEIYASRNSLDRARELYARCLLDHFDQPWARYTQKRLDGLGSRKRMLDREPQLPGSDKPKRWD